MSVRASNPSDLVAQVLVYLTQRRRWPAFRLNAGCVLTRDGRWVRLGPKGCSDVVGLIPPSGRMLCVECKQGSGRLTPHQRAWLEGYGAAGALCLSVGSKEALADALASAGYPEE